MKRFFRLSAYFVFGLLLGGSVVFYSASASAAVQGAFVWHGLDGPFGQAVEGSSILGEVSPFSKPAFSAGTAGAVEASAGATLKTSAAQGAKAAVSTALKVKSVIPTPAIAKVVAKTLVPGGLMVSLVAPVLIEAGLQYAEGRFQKKTTETPFPIEVGYYWWSLGSCTTLASKCTFDVAVKSVVDYHAATRPTHTNWAFSRVTSKGSTWAIIEMTYTDTSAVGSPTKTESRTLTASGTACPTGYTISNGYCVPDAAYKDVSDSEVESAIAEALAKRDNTALVQGLPAGTPIDMGTPTVSGPAQSVSAPVTTTNNINNVTTTTTTQTIVNNTYNNNTVTSSVINQTVTKDAAGNVISTTNEEAQPENVEAVADKALPDVPKLYTRKYPEGMVGVWNTGIAAIKATPIFSLPQVFAPTGIDGGTCPAWSFNANIGPAMNFGIGSVAPPCYVWPFIKVIVIICALMLARALVFGG